MPAPYFCGQIYVSRFNSNRLIFLTHRIRWDKKIGYLTTQNFNLRHPFPAHVADKNRQLRG